MLGENLSKWASTDRIGIILELATPFWHSSLSLADKSSIDQVQKAALQIILGPVYASYASACNLTNLLILETRRVNLCKNLGEVKRRDCPAG